MSDKKDSITINIGGLKKLSKNPWAISTVIFAVATIVFLVLFLVNTGSSSSGAAISSAQAGQKVIDFANSQGAQASLVEVNDAGNLYEVVITLQGQQVPLYVTKDGKSFTTTLIPLDEDLPSSPKPTPTNDNIDVTIDSTDPILGDATAKVTVIEYSDFECPFCERAYSTTVADLKNSEEFKSGEVNFVYRHFPLNSIHPRAQKAAEASVCAQEQGKFYEYHDKLFENQRALDIESLKSYAADLGLDTEAFNNCLDSGAAEEKVAKDLASATANGGQGTPYFIILNNENGKTSAVSGAVPYSQIESAIAAVQ